MHVMVGSFVRLCALVCVRACVCVCVGVRVNGLIPAQTEPVF